MKPRSNIGNYQCYKGYIFISRYIVSTYASKLHKETVKNGGNRLQILKLGPEDPHDSSSVTSCIYLGVMLKISVKPYK